jgi:hypothetical protein
MLIAVTMSWSTSWHHYSTVDGEACGPGGLWRSWRAASSVASAPTPGGGMVAIAAKRCWCATAAVTPAVVLALRVVIRWDQPTLEWEVASYSVPC